MSFGPRQHSGDWSARREEQDRSMPPASCHSTCGGQSCSGFAGALRSSRTLGAGYGVPITAVLFVAEMTGQPGFIIPGAVAVVSAQLAMSNRTVSPAQSEGG